MSVLRDIENSAIVSGLVLAGYQCYPYSGKEKTGEHQYVISGDIDHGQSLVLPNGLTVLCWGASIVTLEEHEQAMAGIQATWEASQREEIDGNSTWRAFHVVGASSEPYCWFDKQGNFRANPNYIKPALNPEPVQYGQCLVGYELC